MIKLLADENIPKKTVDTLRQEEIDIVSVAESSPGMNDRTILEQANRDNRVIVTFDKDFGELVFRESLSVRGLILLRFTPISPNQIAERIQSVLTQVTPIEDKIIVVEEDRIRVTVLN